MNQMGNLEKLGILVIVILVVVVGVVAITPKDQVDEALFPTDEQAAPAPLDPAAPEVAAEPKWPGATPTPMANVGDRSAPAAQDPTAPAGPVVDANGLPLAPTPAPAPAAPATTEYVVVKNDTGVSIAKKTLGSANRWPEIVAVNPGLDARKLKIGQRIVIPATTNPVAVAPALSNANGGTSPAQAPGAGGTAVAPIAPTPEPAAPAAERIYVVQRGDTLSDIARREMGSASKYALIRDANADVLHGSDVVRPGMKLRIPAASTARTAAAPASGSSPAANGKTYKVQSGDTLMSIAARFLGSSSRWKELLKSNDPVLHGSTNLRVGMELTLPDDVSAR